MRIIVVHRLIPALLSFLAILGTSVRILSTLNLVIENRPIKIRPT